MLRVPLVHAREGMVLAMPVQHPDSPSTVLLQMGVPLTRVLIGRLREICCREVWIEFPGLDEIREYVKPEIQEQHAFVTAQISSVFDEVLEQWRPRLHYMSYRNAVLGLIQDLIEHPQASIFTGEIVSAKKPMLRHASNVCLLSLLIGLNLEFYLARERPRLPVHRARDVTGLGVGAMLHDIGMLRLENDAANRWSQSGDETDPQFREHVHLGYRLVRGSVDPSASAVVLHHHQRFDGSGFPDRRSPRGKLLAPTGSRIHVFARIAAAADLFDRLRYQRGTLAEPLPVVRVLSMLANEPYAAWIDPVVRIALINVIPPFCPGSIIMLNTGDRAVVVGWSPLDPCRPCVRLLPSLNPNDMLRGPEIDLRIQREYSVAQAEGHEVVDDLFHPATPQQFDLGVLRKRLVRRSVGSISDCV